jgi:hypothetical protein
VSADSLAGQMRTAAVALLGRLDHEQRALAARPFAEDAARRWLEYRPRQRPGACLAELTPPARKAAHRLLATGLSEHAYAQAMGIVALEEVLDRKERWQRGRHSGDYWVSVYGDPEDGQPWSWRFEGHHLSVTMTVAGQEVSPAPVFFGANPACVSYAGRPVSRPLGPEEDLVRALLDAMGTQGRSAAVVAGHAPADIRTATSSQASHCIEPLGVAAADLGPAPRALLTQLAATYLDRLPPELAAREAGRLDGANLHFAWEGSLIPEARHYYRVQGDDLLIEYDTTDDGNHAHTVLRRPRGDFGGDVLAAHYARAHP